MMNPEELNALIRGRRAVYPPMYNGKVIPKTVIDTILENANWAPSHRKTEPWRFKVFTGAALQGLSEFLGDFYKKHTPEEKFSQKKYEKNLKKPIQSGCVIAICMDRDEAECVPEWEELAAVACAVQNMWLTATAYGLGAYWSSPGAIHSTRDFLKLGAREQCLGFFFMGYHDQEIPPGKRKDIADKVTWME